MTLAPLLALAIAAPLCWALVPLGIRVAWAIGWLDHPEARKLHTAAMPVLGGAIVFTAAVIAWGITLLRIPHANADWQAPKGTPVAANAIGELFLPLAGLVDVEAEKARQEKELAKVRSEIQKVQDKLANPAFTQKVPASVLAEHQQRLIDWQAKEKQILSTLQ